MTKLERDGEWWHPGHPEERWSGVLRFDEEEGGSLRVAVPHNYGTPPPLTRSLIPSGSVIVGRTNRGEMVTLLDCFEKSSSYGIHGGFGSIDIRANAVVDGFHCNRNPSIDRVSATVSPLTEWWGVSGITESREVEFPNVEVRYTSQSPFVAHDDGRFTVVLRPSCSYDRDRHEMSLRERVKVEVKAGSPRTLSEFQEIVHACEDFVSIACLSLCRRTETLLMRNNKASQAREFGFYYAVPVYSEQQKGGVPFGLFSGADVRERRADVLGTWLSQLDRLRYVRALYFAGVYGRGFAEQKFLFLTQAVEAFHRRYYSGRYIEDQGRFEKTVYEPLVAKIPETAPSGLGDAIRARLKYGNEYSLRRRIGELVREHSQALKVLERRPESWVSEIVDLRNTLTHYPEMDHVPEHRVDAAIRYSWILRLLLEVCFMKTMGFGAEEVQDFVQGCRMYRQVAEMVGDGGSREGESAADR